MYIIKAAQIKYYIKMDKMTMCYVKNDCCRKYALMHRWPHLTFLYHCNRQITTGSHKIMISSWY